MAPVDLGGGVHMVGCADPDSSAFTDSFDCTSYLVVSDAGVALAIDCGTGRGHQRWLDNISQVVSRQAVEALVLTHYHADHAGGAAKATAHFPVLASKVTAAALAAADEGVTSLAVARSAGVYPGDYRLEPASGIVAVEAGRLDWPGAPEVVLIDSAGHCDGHLAVLVTAGARRDLFSGDVVFADGRVSIQALHDCRLDLYAATMGRLASARIDRLFPGHGPWQDTGVRDWIDRSAAAFGKLVPPPNLLSPPGFG